MTLASLGTRNNGDRFYDLKDGNGESFELGVESSKFGVQYSGFSVRGSGFVVRRVFRIQVWLIALSRTISTEHFA